MEKHEFINSRLERVDRTVLGEGAYSGFQRAFPGDGRCSNVYRDQPAATQENWVRIGESAMRRALSDLYDKMEPHQFDGFYNADRLADIMYTRWTLQTNQGNSVPWSQIGPRGHDAWIDIAEFILQNFSPREPGEPIDSQPLVLPEGDIQEHKLHVLESKAAAFDTMEEMLESYYPYAIETPTYVNAPLALKDMMESWAKMCHEGRRPGSLGGEEEYHVEETNDSARHLPSDEDVIKERAKQYGDASHTQRVSGAVATAILEAHYGIDLPHPIPGEVVCLISAAWKLIRAAVPLKFVKDNYVDARNYVTLAERLDPRNLED